MGTPLATSTLPALLGPWLPSPHASQAAPALGPYPPSPLPEVPSLGAPPAGAKGGALVMALATFGALLAGGLALATPAPRRAAPVRTVAVVLASFEAMPAPPPPAGGAQKQGASARPDAGVPERLPDAATPVTPLPTLPTPSQGSAQTGEVQGAPGGQPGGVPGGLPGGQAGGTLGGQVGGVVPPRFDAGYLQNPEPDYPSLSKRLGEEGKVVLRVLVNADGLPEQVEIRQSSGHPRLDQAALGTVRRWRFTPARRGAERLAAWVLVPLSFQLDV